MLYPAGAAGSTACSISSSMSLDECVWRSGFAMNRSWVMRESAIVGAIPQWVETRFFSKTWFLGGEGLTPTATEGSGCD